MITLLLKVGGVGFITALLGVGVWRSIGRRLGFVTTPKSNRFSDKAVIQWGGLPLGFALAAAVFVAASMPDDGAGEIVAGILTGTGVAWLVGLVDDKKDLNPWVKIAGLLLAAVAAWYQGWRPTFTGHPEIDMALGALWLVACGNAWNVVDNMDGLATGATMIGAAGLAVVSLFAGVGGTAVLAVAAVGVAAGFMVHNFPPARIYMGDGGALAFGFLLGAIAASPSMAAEPLFLGAGFFCLLIPFFDAIFCTVTRTLRGQSPMKGGTDHPSHRLVALGLSVRSVDFLLWGLGCLGVCTAVLAVAYSPTLASIPGLLLLITLVFLGRYLWKAQDKGEAL